jgi:dihydropteroate synthase
VTEPAGSARESTRVWRCGAFDLSLDRPLVMGILNVTPDSFSDGGLHDGPLAAASHGERLISQGAAILDIGGESTRPGAAAISVAEELARVRPVVARFASEGLVPVSIDTRRPDVAAACLDAGASIINDVSGFRDERMVELAASCDAGLVVMHMLGEPGTMQQAPRYDDVVSEVGGYLLAQAAMLEAAGVARERIAIDPGIGFGKTLEHNLALVRATSELAALGYPLVVGASRKRFIGEVTGVEEPAERLGGSVAAAIFVAERGASVVRVHDVGQTVQALAVFSALDAK